MGLFSRRQAAKPPVSPAAPAAPAPTTHAEEPPRGRYGPLVSIERFDTTEHEELGWQVPLDGELYRLVAGPDRPDYSLMLLEKPLHFYPAPTLDLTRVDRDLLTEDRKGRRMVRVHALALCARFVGQQVAPGMKDLPVNVAFVIDSAALREPTLDFAKIEYAAVGFLSEGHHASWAALAHALRAGIEAERGAPVEQLHVTLTIDDAFHVSGLTGNADGKPPAPTPGTFDELNRILGRLRAQPRAEPVRAVTLSVEGDAVTTTLEP